MEKGIAHYEFKPGLPVEFEIIPLEVLYRDKWNMITNPHRAAFYQVVWFRKGNATHTVDFLPIHIEDDALLFLNKDTVHSFDPKIGIEGFVILFTDSFFYQSDADAHFLKTNILFNDLWPISSISLAQQFSVFQDILQLMEKETKLAKDAFHASILKEYLYSFLLQAERLRKDQISKEIRQCPEFDCVILFRDLLEINNRKHREVSYYAASLSVTEKRLNQASTKVIGKTPKQMIDDRVMLEAKRLLAHTNDSVKEIGFTIGFEESTNFIKYFRKHHGLTPSEFRASLF
jgi:AraC family transcriptional activator of pobA